MKICIGGDVVICNKSIKNIFNESVINKINEHTLFVYNLEGPIINKAIKKINKKGPTIFQSSNVIEELKNISTLVCLANNHIMDYGREGLANTINLLEANNCYYVGAKLDSDVYMPYVDHNEKIAIFNVCESGFGMENSGTNGYGVILSKKLLDLIQVYKSKEYSIIVMPHAGAENIKYPLPEIRDLYKMYIDFGADLVVGNHPHIIQGKEKYKGKNIYYSLGNLFFNDDEDSKNLYNPRSLLLSISIHNKIIEIEEIFLKEQNGKISIDMNMKKDFDKISEILQRDNEYLNIIDNFCKEIYDNVYRYYINYENGLFLNTLRSKVKSIIKLIYKKDIIDKGWIMHNYINETNRWIIARAIKGDNNENNN